MYRTPLNSGFLKPPRRFRGGSALVVAVLFVTVSAGFAYTAAAQGAMCPDPSGTIPQVIDFSAAAGDVPLSAGDIIGTGPGEFQFDGMTVSVTGTSPSDLPLMIFDTERNPSSGGDPDLGSPNAAYGGPGIGTAGAPAGAGPNPVGLGNALIISEQTSCTGSDLTNGICPDDDGDGGTIIFVFDEAVEVREIHTLDADDSSLGEARVYSDTGGTNLIGGPFFGQDLLADDGFQIIDVSTTGARRLEFAFQGSGAITKLLFCGNTDQTSTFGNTVFHDIDGDGTQDAGETGIAGVKIHLRNNEGVAIDSMTTDGSGAYDFTSLLGADYTADVDESTLPAGVSLTTGNEPDTHTLGIGEDYNDADFGYNGGALPVELTAFEAVVDGADVLLAWETASETNNAGFEIQWISKNGDAWKVLDFVEGHGTTEFAQAYACRIEDLAPGRHVFRLKQIDFDGTFEYHAEVEVVVEMVERFVMEPAYPNPFNPQAQFGFAVSRSQTVHAALYDMLGRRMQVLYEGVPLEGQMQTVQIDGSMLPSGLYVVRVVGETFVQAQTVTLLR